MNAEERTEMLKSLPFLHIQDLSWIEHAASCDEPFCEKAITFVDLLLATLADQDAELARHHKDFERWENMANDAVKRTRIAEDKLREARADALLEKPEKVRLTYLPTGYVWDWRPCFVVGTTFVGPWTWHVPSDVGLEPLDEDGFAMEIWSSDQMLFRIRVILGCAIESGSDIVVNEVKLDA